MMSQTPVIIFVCEHGAAESIIAATYFNKIAKEMELQERAIARGTHPDQELSQNTLTGLHKDGLTSAEARPQKLSLQEIEAARRVISFCDLPESYLHKNVIERWEDVPPVSENYQKARDAILTHLNHLVHNL
jgi:protein-tyrosine-phosphatase